MKPCTLSVCLKTWQFSQCLATHKSYRKKEPSLLRLFKIMRILCTYLSYFQYGRSPHEYSVLKKSCPLRPFHASGLNRQVKCQLQKLLKVEFLTFAKRLLWLVSFPSRIKQNKTSFCVIRSGSYEIKTSIIGRYQNFT